jgi:Spy/CpxP family protein refolding chaperone
MRSTRTTLLALTAAALLASPAFAQPPGGGRGGMQMGRGGGIGMLLSNASVQEELKLDDKQKDKIKDFAAKQREAQQGLRDLDQDERRAKMQELTKQAEAFAKEVLTADQQKRIKQLVIQTAGLRAFAMDDVVKELKLSDEQKDKIKTLSDDLQKDMRELFQGGGDPQENMTKMQSLNKEYMTKAAAVLTADQKKQWTEMTGKAFTLRMQRPTDR